ncbi:MAG TPA: LON peptidase substrate-binding domain-containing protein [Nocardioidaceae bacterium]|nr:LON peptidase substrate-binding domain-containing protein [Nocardioidaceae bacterium]
MSEEVSEGLPIFPLSTVLFPGVTLPLHIFEDRYRSLVSTLLAQPEGEARVFGIVAIREGYEVGSRGVHSVQRVGCSAQLTSVEPYDDGRFDIEVVGRRRIRIDALDTGGEFLVGEVAWLDEPVGEGTEEAVARARRTFEAYRVRLLEASGKDITPPDDLPTDASALSYSLAAACLLTQLDRQALLEADDATSRLRLATSMMRAEMRAIRALPSLPATEVARTGWSPN